MIQKECIGHIPIKKQGLTSEQIAYFKREVQQLKGLLKAANDIQKTALRNHLYLELSKHGKTRG